MEMHLHCGNVQFRRVFAVEAIKLLHAQRSMKLAFDFRTIRRAGDMLSETHISPPQSPSTRRPNRKIEG
jgi:hypothetical protein